MNHEEQQDQVITQLQARLAELEKVSRNRRRPLGQLLVIALSIVLALGVGGTVYASIPGPDGVIHGCYAAGGPLKVIDSSTTCPGGQTALNWNQTGPQGPKGDKGDKGDPRTPGAPGSQGPQGPAGLTWRGPWSASTAYAANDAVSYPGSAWIAAAANTGSAPGALFNTSWNLLPSKGEQGVQGVPGQQGIQGPPGVQGQPGQPAGASAQEVDGAASNPRCTLSLPVVGCTNYEYDAFASCPSGTVPTGGGFSSQGVTVSASRPNVDLFNGNLLGWTASGDSAAGNASLRAWAICINS